MSADAAEAILDAGKGMPTYSLTIPGYIPTSLNRLLATHPAGRSRLKRQDADLIGWYASLNGVPHAQNKRRVSLACTHTRGSGPDPDNLLKVALDALVTCRLLVDDSARWCEIGTVQVRRGSVRETVVTLQDLPA